ncbi:MAG: GGDEF domain-containing protein [Oceanococcaceae bacterium]
MIDLDSVRHTVILCSAALLLVALLPVRRLLQELPDGLLRRSWLMLGGLLLVMIGAEIMYAVGFSSNLPVARELAIPITLLVGSWYIMLVSQLAAGSVEDVQRTALLERESITDPLTGLYNRRYLHRLFAAEIERARRYQLPLSLALVDADHFKAINQNYGHQVGDQVLRQFAKLIGEQTQINDTVARYGGEEIAVVLPGSKLEDAREFAERLRHRIQGANLDVLDGDSIHRIRLTASIGVSQFDVDEGARPEPWIERADRALAAAKAAGRNAVHTL